MGPKNIYKMILFLSWVVVKIKNPGIGFLKWGTIGSPVAEQGRIV